MDSSQNTVNGKNDFSCLTVPVATRVEIPAARWIDSGWIYDSAGRRLNDDQTRLLEGLVWVREGDLFGSFPFDGLFLCHEVPGQPTPVRVLKEAIHTGSIPVLMTAIGLDWDAPDDSGWNAEKFRRLAPKFEGELASRLQIWMTPGGIRGRARLATPVWLKNEDDLLRYEARLRRHVDALIEETGLDWERQSSEDATRQQRIARGTRAGQPVRLPIYRRTFTPVEILSFEPRYKDHGHAPANYVPQLAREAASRGDLMTRVAAYIAAVAPSVQGQHGHSHALSVMLRVISGFDLSYQQALDAGREFNGKCQPPWPQSQFDRDYSYSAWRKAQTSNRRGELLVESSPYSPPLPDIDWNAEMAFQDSMRVQYEAQSESVSVYPERVLNEQPTAPPASPEPSPPRTTRFQQYTKIAQEYQRCDGALLVPEPSAGDIADLYRHWLQMTSPPRERDMLDCCDASDDDRLRYVGKQVMACYVGRLYPRTHHLESIGGIRVRSCGQGKYCYRCARRDSLELARGFIWTMIESFRTSTVRLARFEFEGDDLSEARENMATFLANKLPASRIGRAPLLRVNLRSQSRTSAGGQKARCGCLLMWPSTIDESALVGYTGASPTSITLEAAWVAIRAALDVPPWMFTDRTTVAMLEEWRRAEHSKVDARRSQSLVAAWERPPDSEPEAEPGDPEKGQFRAVYHLTEIVQLATRNPAGATAVIDTAVTSVYRHTQGKEVYEPVVRLAWDANWDYHMRLPKGRSNRPPPAELRGEFALQSLRDMQSAVRKIASGSDSTEAAVEVCRFFWEAALKAQENSGGDSWRSGLGHFYAAVRRQGTVEEFFAAEMEWCNSRREAWEAMSLRQTTLF